eukprot:m.251367 g.251367  ORF g.251367 m.251367 type:complete len:324 (-) comp19536_c0_seq17:162-1133(-)
MRWQSTSPEQDGLATHSSVRARTRIRPEKTQGSLRLFQKHRAVLSQWPRKHSINFAVGIGIFETSQKILWTWEWKHAISSLAHGTILSSCCAAIRQMQMLLSVPHAMTSASPSWVMQYTAVVRASDSVASSRPSCAHQILTVASSEPDASLPSCNVARQFTGPSCPESVPTTSPPNARRRTCSVCDVTGRGRSPAGNAASRCCSTRAAISAASLSAPKFFTGCLVSTAASSREYDSVHHVLNSRCCLSRSESASPCSVEDNWRSDEDDPVFRDLSDAPGRPVGNSDTLIAVGVSDAIPCFCVTGSVAAKICCNASSCVCHDSM